MVTISTLSTLILRLFHIPSRSACWENFLQTTLYIYIFFFSENGHWQLMQIVSLHELLKPFLSGKNKKKKCCHVYTRDPTLKLRIHIVRFLYARHNVIYIAACTMGCIICWTGSHTSWNYNSSLQWANMYIEKYAKMWNAQNWHFFAELRSSKTSVFFFFFLLSAKHFKMMKTITSSSQDTSNLLIWVINIRKCEMPKNDIFFRRAAVMKNFFFLNLL